MSPLFRPSLVILGLLIITSLKAAPTQAGRPLKEPAKEALWPGLAPDGFGKSVSPEDSGITCHLALKPNGMAVVVCPGGGYGGLMTGPEGHGIAKWLNQHGITGIVLEYRMPAGRFEVPLLDAQRALRLTRIRAAEWKVNPKRVGILGFSAGGHLAATTSTQFDSGKPDSKDLIERQSSRPDFAVLIYPVISMGPLGHSGSRQALLGDHPADELIHRFSCERQVTPRTPPTFLAHAVDDIAVSVENSRLHRDALRKQSVPQRLLELPDGGHGLNGYKGTSWDKWQRDCLVWLNQLPK